MQDKSPYQRSTLSLFFGIFTAASVTVVLGLASLLLVFHRAHEAVLTLGIGLCFIGVMRGLWPGHPWFGSRNKVADVVAYLLVGLGLLFFSSGVSVLPAG